MGHPEAPSDPDVRHGALPSGSFAYTDEGDGPAIVLIHGAPGSVRDFRWLAPALADRFRVVRVDLPGFGATSAATHPGFAPEDRADFVLAAMSALGLESAILAGHSMGGIVSVAAAHRAPARVRGVALLASPGFVPHRGFRRIPRRPLSAWFASPRRTALTRPLLRGFFAAAGFRGPYPDEVLVNTLHTVAAVRFEAHARRLEALACPALVAWCADDPLIEPSIPAELAARLPDGPRVHAPTGGHNPQKYLANEIGAALTAWREA